MAAKATTTTTTQNKSLIEPSRAAVKSNLIDQDSISFLCHGFPNFWNRKFKRSVLEWCPSYADISLLMLYLWLLTGMFININFQIFYIIFLFYFEVLTNKYILISISGSSVVLMILSFKMNAFLQELILSWFIAVRGEYFRNFWVGMCRWDPGTLNPELVQLNFATLY